MTNHDLEALTEITRRIVKAELSRVEAEQFREIAEQARQSAEEARVVAEEARAIAEDVRQQIIKLLGDMSAK